MNIIFMEPIYKDYIWGGQKLKHKFKKNAPFKKTAESWEISSNENGNCKIKNKEYEGKNLKELFEDEQLKKDIFGRKCLKFKEFPLLIKFIDARENLSIQVHPDDAYAKKMGLNNGKSEMWYIIDCKAKGKIIAGINKNLEKKELKETIECNNVKKYLKYIEIKKGDSIYIPAGTLHAILKNTFICEIQQNSDITYRVYDWDRKDSNGNNRTLNYKEALDVIKTKNTPYIIHNDNKVQEQILSSNKFFEVKKINNKKTYIDYSDENTFYAINILNGAGILQTNNRKYKIKRGDSFIIPATLGEYKINGKIEALKSYVV